MQKYVNLVDLVKSFPTSIHLQKSASIQPRTISSKFGGIFNSLFSCLLGVKGDASRTSVLRVAQPFMGLLPAAQTSSWSEAAYRKVVSNSCWELYGVQAADQYPRSDMIYDMHVDVDAAAQGSFKE